MAYDFSTLAPADFEDLSRELIGRELKCRFEAFTAGPDDGIDGRHSKGPNAIILQAKHTRGSTFASLKVVMKREREAVDRLRVGRYILTTSRPLTPGNKKILAEVIGPSLQSEADIFGPDDLNQLLRSFPDVEKAHIKLWLSSTATLERVLFQAQHAFTAITLEEIQKKVLVYAQNPSFPESKAILDECHVLIISGPPGVGKTTLAEILSYAYAGEGWELVPIRSLEDGFAAIDDTKRRVYFFDDFLGKIELDSKTLALRENDLARFIKRIRSSPNARFILTTRAYIYEEARRSSEALADKRLEISRYILDVGKYTRRIRARILYNHLEVSGIGSDYVSALISSGELKKIVDHKHYNPRVIEWMTDRERIQSITCTDYGAQFLKALDHPHELWDHAFRHRSAECHHLLIALFFSPEYGISIDRLRTAFDALHPHLSRLYGHPYNPKDFEEALRILDGGFLNIRGQEVSFINPSLRDYLAAYLKDVRVLVSCAAVCPSADWSLRVWRHRWHGQALAADDEVRLARAFIPVARTFGPHPVTRRRTVGGGTTYEEIDGPISARLEALVEWFAETEAETFLDIGIELLNTPDRSLTADRDGEKLVDLAQEINLPIMLSDAPKLTRLRELAESTLIELLDEGLSIDDLATISEKVFDSKKWLNPSVEDAVKQAIFREFDEVRYLVGDINSTSTLQDYGATLEQLAARADIDVVKVKDALEIVQERIDEIGEEVTPSTSPSISGHNASNEIFDDAALFLLFRSLAH